MKNLQSFRTCFNNFFSGDLSFLSSVESLPIKVLEIYWKDPIYFYFPEKFGKVCHHTLIPITKLNNLEKLNLSGMVTVNDAFLVTLVEKCRELKDLKINCKYFKLTIINFFFFNNWFTK